MSEVRHRVGIDIGGTFTDAVCVSTDGSTRTAKAMSTPGNLAEGVLAAIRGLGIDLADCDWLVHGTTAGLNAVLERRGARAALLTTAGFADVLAIGRTNRPPMYDLFYRTPEPLIDASDIFEVRERMGARGDVVTELDTGELAGIARRLHGYEAVGVLFLHAYANADHERTARAILEAALPGVPILCSHEIAPEWREYERASTTAASAYVVPPISGYLTALEAALAGAGLGPGLRVMQSNGGVMTVPAATRKPVQTLFSGPVGGTAAGVAIAADLGLDHLICADMGGTSFDVSLVVDGAAEISSQASVEGFPLLMQAVPIHTIGAGGGSIAAVRAGGLRVGPQSAGAVPGPACYGRGGTQPTVTDANLVLGRLPAAARLGGDMALDAAAASAAVAGIAAPLGMSVADAAAGIVAVADAAMANAIREITVARGIDPREFTLVAFGGAGALHAAAMAADLEISQVVIPANPGVLSAWGMLHADTRHDVSTPLFDRIDDLNPGTLERLTAELAERGRAALRADGVPEDAVTLEPAAELRYVGQEYSLAVRWPQDEPIETVLSELPKRFAAQYLDRYGHNNPGEAVECIGVRMTAIGAAPRLPRTVPPEADMPAPAATQDVIFAGAPVPAPVYQRGELPAGAELPGPAIVLESSCTTLIPPGWDAAVSASGHLIMTRRTA